MLQTLDRINRDGKTYVEIGVLAEQFGYNREYLRKLAKSKLDAILIGDCYLINPESLQTHQDTRKNLGPHGAK